MAPDLPAATQRLLEAVPGLEAEIHFFSEGTKTAKDAAMAVGCPVSAIVKSLVFMAVHDDHEEPVLGLVPGDLRLDVEAFAKVAGASSTRRASLEEVRSATGYAAGGTPPFGHISEVRVFADCQLERNDPVWAAGGTPTTVFPISIMELDRLARPTWAAFSLSS
ncbi:MAG: YbaK/EbsC family protein [Actinomycetota bacterium]|nr:YbaK/EbsC family protein [Actinomycetota bacterium]